jgi:DNA-binding transcriptional LysR family regulator
MELRQLEHFVSVAEEGSFTRAAKRMHIVQSGLSMSIRALEEELGTELFARSPRGVALTPAGEAMLPEARRAIAAVEAARAAVGATQGLLRGTLGVGVTQASPDGGRLARIFGQFHSDHPGVSIRVFQGAGNSLFDGLHEGRLDLVIAGRPITLPDSVTTIQLVRSPYAFACSMVHPLAERSRIKLDELAGETFMDLGPSWVTRQHTDHAFAAAGIERRIVCELDDVHLLLQMVEHGLGVAIVPRMSERIAPVLRYVPVEPALPEWQLVAGFSGTQPANEAARVLLGMVTREWLNR